MSARVLVADARALMRGWIRSALAPFDVAVVEAPTSTSALRALAREGPFDLVIAGSSQEARGGLALLAQARAAGWRTPFVIVARAPAEADHAAAAVAGGAVVLDPADGPAVLATLARRALARVEAVP